jgi:hypothetical protein
VCYCRRFREGINKFRLVQAAVRVASHVTWLGSSHPRDLRFPARPACSTERVTDYKNSYLQTYHTVGIQFWEPLVSSTFALKGSGCIGGARPVVSQSLTWDAAHWEIRRSHRQQISLSSVLFNQLTSIQTSINMSILLSQSRVLPNVAVFIGTIPFLIGTNDP